MKNNENSLRINIAESGRSSVSELLPAVFAAFGAAFGFSAMLFGALPSAGIPPIFGIFIGIFAAVLVLMSNHKYGKYAAPIASAAALLAVLAVPQFRNGLLILGNDIADFMTAVTGRIYLPFSVSGDAAPKIAAFFAAATVSALLSTAFSAKTVFPALPAAALSTAGLLFGFLSTDIYFIFFAAGFVWLILCILAPKNKGAFSAKGVFSSFAVPAASVLLSLVLAAFVPVDFGLNIRDFASDELHSVIYDSGTNAMPEGDLSDLGPFEKSDSAALEVIMEQPQKLYLKSFVGEVYTGYSWKNLSSEVLGEYSDDFYWLHRNGFFVQSEISSALGALSEQDTLSMSIKNVSACSERAFLPYALSSAELDPLSIGDAETDSFGKSYTVSYIPGGLSEWYLAQVALSEKQGKSESADAHLANESVYREFVRANYLEVPAGAYEAIDNIFAEEDASTATEIISAILLYLESGVSYDENAVTRNGTEDFTAFFLEKTARGYSVHYATAATLMLRYFGIPARYVEGYFLSAAEAAEYESDETIILTENHAHAWAEYYLDGVGWVPFEVTPGYMDDELEKAAFTTDGESSKRYEQSELPETDVEHDRPKDDITEAEKDLKPVIIAVSAVILLLILGLAAYVLIMRKRLKNALGAIAKADNKTGAALCYGYAEKLLENAKISDETLASFGKREAEFINREALFSEHEITDEQRRTVDDYAKKVLEECKKSWNLWEKFKNKFIKFIY